MNFRCQVGCNPRCTWVCSDLTGCIVAMISSRILNPGSKLATTRSTQPRFLPDDRSSWKSSLQLSSPQSNAVEKMPGLQDGCCSTGRIGCINEKRPFTCPLDGAQDSSGVTA